MMKVKFVAAKSSSVYPDLTDGKVYEVENTIDFDVDGVTERRYLIMDDDVSEFADLTPYEISVFEVVEG